MCLPASIATSRALIDLGRPTNSGITMWGNTTTSRSGSSGSVIGSAGNTGCPDIGYLSFSALPEGRAGDYKAVARAAARREPAHRRFRWKDGLFLFQALALACSR